jgi:cysteinyl-tRNA synthetase
LLAREKARASGQYNLADELRDSLLNVGINVNDGPSGATWSLNS